jgi:hypothetical protein
VKLKQLNKSAIRPKSLVVSQEIFKVTFGADDEDVNTDPASAASPSPDLQHIHYLKTDGAAEFMGSELSTFCEENGIEKKASCGHTQQQNPGEPAVKLVTQGIAILHRQLPLTSKWVYAFRFFCHVYGYLPNTGLPDGFDTPYEAAQQRQVDFKLLTKHTHPYGCLCFLHIPKVLRVHTHGVDKGLPCANMGFARVKEGFVVLTLKTRTVIEGVWDLFFVEDRFPIAELHAEQLLQGLPAEKQLVTKRWAGVDLSWKSLTSGTDHDEGMMGTDMDADLQVATAPMTKATPTILTSPGAPMDTCDTVATADAPADSGLGMEAAATRLATDANGMTNWENMPRLEPILEAERLNTSLADTTLLQIKRAMTSQRPTPSPPTEEQPSGLRRSGRARQPSHESLIAIANRVPTAPPSTKRPATNNTPTVLEIDEDAVAIPPMSDEKESGSASPAPDLDECAMLTSVQKEAEAAYSADPTALPAPERYGDAMRRMDKAIWLKTMHEHLMKLRRIGEHGVYRVIRREQAGNVMKSQWVYSRKLRAHHEDGQVTEDSARAVAGGYGQIYGEDFTETYAPTMPMESYKANEAGAINDPDVIREEYDFKGAYYQSYPTLKQYMEQPPGIAETPESFAAINLKATTVPDFTPIHGARSKYVWELLRCMPGTKDAGHNFNEQMSTYLVAELKLQPNPADTASFYGIFGKEWIRLNSYIDDLTVFSNSQPLMDHCFARINLRFPCKRRAGINLIVGVTVTKSEGTIAFDQKRLIEDVANYTGQCDAGSERTPFPSGWAGFTKEDCITDPDARAILDQWPFPNAVGKVAYVARCTRYDTLWLVSILQRHFKNYGPAMIEALLRLVRFLYTTRTKPLIFKAGYPKDLHPLVVMVDASYASSKIDGSSHDGVLVFYNGCPIHASSKRQRVVALSSMESEFMAANRAARFAIWLQRMIVGFGLPAPMPFPIMEDNTATIYLARKPNLNGARTRHMEVRWHWLQQQVIGQKVVLHHLRTQFQVADVLTKGVDHGTFNRLEGVLLGHVPVWEFGNGVLRRALDPGNALTREGLLYNRQHAQAAPPIVAREQAAMMYEQQYNDDMMGDGITAHVTSAAQELAAMMYGSRYSGDVTGDGAAEPPEDQLIQWYGLPWRSNHPKHIRGA